jgi:hypothetical protein
MARTLVTFLLLALALGFLGAGVWLGVSGDGDVDFGITAALLCAAPMLAVLALAMQLGADEED